MLSRKLVGTLSLAAASCVLWAGTAQAAVIIDLVPVGNAGNTADTAAHSGNPAGQGQVNYAYSIGKYDVTAGQYTEFLNAVAKTDTYGLYNSGMASGFAACGISQTGTSGNYTYAITKNANFPVNNVSFWDACRFTNWLQNNQPTNVGQVAGTTETGAYDLTVAGAISGNTATRTTGASWSVASEDEWYKAAYYKGGSANAGYWLYPTQSNTAPSNLLSASGTNNANYYISGIGYTDPVNYLTAVGAFAASPSAYGTFDQGGDVFQWNDTSISGSSRGLRGGSFNDNDNYLQSGFRYYDYPSIELTNIGFRVSQVPEPASMALLALGGIGMLVRRRGVPR